MTADGSKTAVSLQINTIVGISDNGHLGTSASVEEHIEQAKTEVEGWQWFVQKPGPREPELVRVRTRVVGVTIIPTED